MSKKENRKTSIQSRQTKSLEDLELTPEQAEETKAGTGAHGGGGGAGKVSMQDFHFVMR
jgi:hypothetical protein